MKFSIVAILVFLLLLSSLSVYFFFEMLFSKGPWKRSTAQRDLEARDSNDRTVAYPFYHAIYNPSDDLSQPPSTYCVHFDANTSSQVTVSDNADIMLNVRQLMKSRVAEADEKEKVTANDSDGVEGAGHGQLEESVPLLNAGKTD
ncbi:hypothetical protein D9758_016488 [Tetrapyrgos nigripes]|uniref:Uncharacterized protein n=1 Tax=Tetrapyrgos nigripes TaxID=182062 RepID=A0A8H5FNS9_9AGAR|nr:hypothetical protein D9758_016488 [Tetrapyrgos nigripes]